MGIAQTGGDEPAPTEAPASRTHAPLPGKVKRLEHHEASRYRAAAAHARRIHPGALGELVSRELLAYAEFGYRFAGDALIPRLAAEVLATPSRPRRSAA